MALTIIRRHCRVLLAVLLLVLSAGAAWAQAGQVYTATGIDVDITGDIATLRDQALLEGQRKALQKVLSDIAPADRVASLTLPSDDVISGWVQDFQIEQEKTSATRYIGRFTFRFMAEPVQQFLAGNNVAFAQMQTKRLLVLPVYTDEAGNSNLWGPANLWLGAWSVKAPNVSLVPMILPSGDVSDTSTLSATQALAGDLPRLTALAERYGAGDVLVAEARASPPGEDGKQTLAITATRYSRETPKSFSDSVTGDATAIDDLLGQSADRTIAWVQSEWKQANLVDASKQSRMTVEVPISSLKQWVDIKKQLGGVPSLKSVQLVSLTRTLAVLDITFLGDLPQFQRSLAQQSLSLAMAIGDPSKGTLRQDANASVGQPPAPAPLPSQMNQPAVPNEPAVPQ
ncbi:DUF2066 domain-containing protein [Dongia deserti]|uniref:DUF2066 domain-containing protein n=1 Tax=Dongia deserti TaxID=2268030 RepID=UPI000E652028|nr:DUF2066 domain-containing protein [Dongia deserti]